MCLFIEEIFCCGYYFGEVSEWLKVHAWKACVDENLPWVQIPPSPLKIYTYLSHR